MVIVLCRSVHLSGSLQASYRDASLPLLIHSWWGCAALSAVGWWLEFLIHSALLRCRCNSYAEDLLTTVGGDSPGQDPRSWAVPPPLLVSLLLIVRFQ